jgi:hypothetical protein
MNTLTSGANLTSPKPSISYVVSASVAVAVLMLAMGVGGWLYGKAKNVTGGISTGAGEMFSGAFGDGTT